MGQARLQFSTGPRSVGMAALLLAVLSMPAIAHDTWFQAVNVRGGGGLLSLGTGNRFPKQEFPIGPEQLRQNGCRSADGSPAALSPVRVGSASLLLRLALSGPPGDATPASPVSCWAQLMPFDVEIAPEIVEVYFRDIAAAPAVRARWADIHARGLPWKERFTKHARIELHGAAEAGAPAAQASGMDMDLLMRSGLGRVRPGDPLVFEVLEGGAPLPALAMELVDASGRSGGWFSSDADGRVRMPAPPAGRWVLHGTDLRPSSTEPDAWESDFVTLAFEVAP
jgi:hypothetical protein